MNYLNEAANGTEGNFTDRCVDQLKQATADNAAWNEANLQLNSALAAARNDRDVAYHHLGNATTELRQSQDAVVAWQRQYAGLTDIQDKYIEERDEARTSLRQMREDRDFLLEELKVAKQKIEEQNKELQDLYKKVREPHKPLRSVSRMKLAESRLTAVHNELAIALSDVRVAIVECQQ